MNLNFLCCIGAEQKHDQSGLLKMNQIYFYRAYADETMSEILEDNFFNHSESHLKENDIILAYSPNEQDLPKVRWLRIVIPHAGLVKTEKVDNSYLLEVLRNDLGDLGDQVQGIEEKIPENASAQNQLATKNQITELQNSKQDIATAVNYDNITNCITEIPQDIKLEIVDGAVVLKAGSKVYVPNGAGVFNQLPVTIDKTATQTTNDTRLYFYNGTYIEKFPIAQCFSGSSAPSGYTYMFWYDTTNNVVKKTSNSGSTWESGWSLPFAICTSTNGAISSIDQVFNGFGYIGSTVFALPGVKGLAPNGRNEDGTLKSNLIQVNSVIARTFNATGALYISLQATGFGGVTKSNYSYDPNANVQYSSGTAFSNGIVFAGCDMSSGVISNWTVLKNNPFHAVDYSDFENTVEELNSSILLTKTELSNSISSTKTELTNSISSVDSSTVHKTGNETIADIKTFEASPIVPTPATNSNNTKAATTAFVKSVLTGNDVGLAKFSKAENGYYKFNNGLIIQWGRITTATATSITLPTPFSSANYSVAFSQKGKASGTVNRVSINGSLTTTSFPVEGVDSSTIPAYWIAIGY